MVVLRTDSVRIFFAPKAVSFINMFQYFGEKTPTISRGVLVVLRTDSVRIFFAPKAVSFINMFQYFGEKTPTINFAVRYMKIK